MFIPILAISQANEDKTLTKAIRLFDNRNFAEAEMLFKEVLHEQPEDFMVNYFYGACRTENNHFTNFDLDCLIKANKEVSPIDIHYYFGKQYHARSNWERALKFYNRYNSIATLPESEKEKLLENIQQCFDKINPYKKYIIKENDENIGELLIINNSSNGDSIVESKNTVADSVIMDETTLVNTVPATNEIVKKEEIPTGEPITFLVNSEITYLYSSHFKTEKGKELFEKGNTTQKKLNSNLKEVDKLRGNYSNAKTREEKKLVGENILVLENQSYSLKKEATEYLFQAKNIEYEYWENASQEETGKFIQKLKQISEQIETDNHTDEKINNDSMTYIDPKILLGKSVNNLSPEKSENDDLIYKIQIGAYSRSLPNYIKRQFNKLSLIRKIENYTDENGVVVYTTGNLRNYEDAIKMQNQVRREGIEDAYVVPYFKRKRITLEQAKKMHNEQ